MNGIPSPAIVTLLRDQWNVKGLLQSARYGHGVIATNKSILIVGGFGRQLTEKCSPEDDQIMCTQQSPELVSYAYYPEMFLVPLNYCKPS